MILGNVRVSFTIERNDLFGGLLGYGEEEFSEASPVRPRDGLGPMAFSVLRSFLAASGAGVPVGVVLGTVAQKRCVVRRVPSSWSQSIE